MMKRSFAEWRAQRSAPEAAAQLRAVDAALEALQGRPWPHCFAGCS